MKYTYKRKTPKSFQANFTWTGFLLLFMGIIFLTIAIVVQLFPPNPENMSSYENGVRVAGTADSAATFQLVFLLAFGITGLGLTLGGIILIWRFKSRQRLNQRLKEEGRLFTAKLLDQPAQSIQTRRNSVIQLRCAYTDPYGKTFIFRTPSLRLDPTHLLHDKEVRVYCDREDMSRYFVDIDGSIELSSNVIEF